MTLPPPAEGGGTVVASDVAVGPEGRVYVVGWENGALGFADYLVWSQSKLGGERWTRRYGFGPEIAHRARHAWAPPDGGIVVTGDTVTVRYDADGSWKWGVPFPGQEMVVGSDNTLYLAGQVGWDFHTVALRPDGTLIWKQVVPREAGGDRAIEGSVWTVWYALPLVMSETGLVQMYRQEMAHYNQVYGVEEYTRVLYGIRWLDHQGRRLRSQDFLGGNTRAYRRKVRAMAEWLTDGRLFIAQSQTTDAAYWLDYWILLDPDTLAIQAVPLTSRENMIPATSILPRDQGGAVFLLESTTNTVLGLLTQDAKFSMSKPLSGQIHGSWLVTDGVLGMGVTIDMDPPAASRRTLAMQEYAIPGGDMGGLLGTWPLEDTEAADWVPAAFWEDPQKPGQILFLGQRTLHSGEHQWVAGGYHLAPRLQVASRSPFGLHVTGTAGASVTVENSLDLREWKIAGSLRLDGQGHGRWTADNTGETLFWRAYTP